MRAVNSPEPDLGKAVVSLSGLVWKIYWLDFDEILYIVYWYGLVVPPLVWRELVTPFMVFWGEGDVNK